VSGTTKILVNDSPATVQALKRIGDRLVDMHGPHDHQSLLSQDFQLNLLDAFGHLEKSRAAYETVYREMLDLDNRRKALDGDDQQVAQQIDLLSFQVKEIEDANLTDADESDLEREHMVVANAQRILELAEGIRRALTEDEMAAFNGMTVVHRNLSELAGLLPEAAQWQKDAESISVQIQELSTGIAGHVQNIEGDPSRLQWLEDRMALIHKFKRKYGKSIPEILQFLATSKERLQDLLTRGQQIAEIEAQLETARKKVMSAGQKLGKERRTTAESLAKAITKELRGLGFPHGAFDVALRDVEPGPSGLDEIEFGLAPNVGEPMRPLRSIASSGEISRVMLATKAVLAGHDSIPVLVFDEIDANVGGEMGIAIGEKLAAVAKNHQVLCITHLPQVAVHGKTHFVVTKEVRSGRTTTRIEPITGNARVEEVARMLGGKGLTSVTLKHAREMLEKMK
jgi:DNA repair protein RecN (Recombination protein N)